MNPFFFLLLAVLTPFGMLLALLGPLYLSMCVAVYVVYSITGNAVIPLIQFTDVFYIMGVYSQLFAYWQDRIFSVGLLSVTLPVAVLPLAAIFFGMWLTRKFVRKMGDKFQVNVLAGD